MSQQQLRDSLLSSAYARLAHLRASAPWGEIAEATVVFALFFGVVGGFAYSTGAFTQSVEQQREDLKKKGVTVSSTGVAIKTDKRAMQPEEIADAMQRSAAKTAALVSGTHAASFRSGAGNDGPPNDAAASSLPPATRQTSKLPAVSHSSTAASKR